MAVTETRLYGPAQPDDAAPETLYTVPGATDTIVKQIVMANTTGSAATVAIGINGVAAADQIVPDVLIAANSVETLDCAIPLAAGETLEAQQGTASAVTVTVSGYEIA